MGKVIVSVCLSVHTPGVPTLARGVPTLARGVPTLTGRYLPWLGVPSLTRVYLPWLGVPTFDGGYLPWPGQHREYMLCGRQYASCVHAGGLSCC